MALNLLSARIGTDRLIDVQYKLRSMGVKLDPKAWMLGDNESVVTSSTIPYSRLGKRHNFLSYHRIRSAIAHGILNFVILKIIRILLMF